MATRLAGVAIKTWFSILFGVMGVVLLGLGLWLVSLPAPYGPRPITDYANVILGPLLIFIGARSYNRPIYWLTTEGFEAYNLLGMRLRLTPMAELAVEREPGGRAKLMRVRPGGRKSVIVTDKSFSMNNEEVGAVIAALEARTAAGGAA